MFPFRFRGLFYGTNKMSEGVSFLFWDFMVPGLEIDKAAENEAEPDFPDSNLNGNLEDYDNDIDPETVKIWLIVSIHARFQLALECQVKTEQNVDEILPIRDREILPNSVKIESVSDEKYLAVESNAPKSHFVSCTELMKKQRRSCQYGKSHDSARGYRTVRTICIGCHEHTCSDHMTYVCKNCISITKYQ